MNQPEHNQRPALLSFQFGLCVTGSALILLFALGLEIGHPAADAILVFLIRNTVSLLILSAGVCVWTILTFFKERRS